MALVFCTKCGHQVSTEAPACPGCGAPRAAAANDVRSQTKATGLNAVRALISLGVAIFGLYYFLGGGVENKVATDAVDEYNIAKRHGDSMDVCVHAGLVVAAYLQAKDESAYSHWKNIENADCAAAGMPSP